MKAVYVTYPWFLDFSLEYIKELSKRIELHVVVVSQENKRSSTIFELSEDFRIETGKFYTLTDLGASLQDNNFYEEYIHACKSFVFTFTPIKWYSKKNLYFNLELKRYIKKHKPDIVHFDDITIEIFWQSLFLRKINLICNVHDPVAHSGEKNRRRDFVRKIIYPQVSRFITFSDYSKRVFTQNYGYQSSLLSLVPYTFYSKYKVEQNKFGRYILFFGRVSPYKGIEDLINAFIQLKEKGIKEKLVIAGKSVYGYSIPSDILKNEDIIYIDRFLENKELRSLISNSEFVVCPYKDATQSGVVMTTFALKKKVLVSRVGGLYETVNDSSGVVFEPNDIEVLSYEIERMLYEDDSLKPFSIDKKVTPEFNVSRLLKIYQANATK